MTALTRRLVPAHLVTLLVASLITASAAPAAASPQGFGLAAIDLPTPAAVAPQGIERVVAAAQPQCTGGVIYDDGEQDSGVRFTAAGDASTGADADVVMRFDVGAAGVALEQICACWNRSSEAPADFEHDLIFYAADGPGGEPGTELRTVPAVAEGVPVAPSSQFITYPLGGLSTPIVSTSRYLYAGVRFNGGGQGQPGHILCTDQEGTGDDPPIYYANADEGNWLPLDDLFPPTGAPEAIMVRVTPEQQQATCPAVPCVEDEKTLCLNEDRFQVTSTWTTVQNGETNTGEGDAGTFVDVDDTGYFTFFNSDNVEVVVKVLDACVITDHFWVFAGGLTNVEVELRVCDTQEGVLKTYANPQGAPFQPIQDTGAFETCP